MAEVDPLLPARLGNLAIVTQAENRIRNGYWAALTRWLNGVRDAVMSPFRESGGTVPPQPSGLPDNAVWVRLVDEHIIPPVRQSIYVPWRTILGEDNNFSQDAFVRDYLQEVTARMVRLPLEVYADITRIISQGLDAGSSVPEIAASIQQRLTATGSDYWPNRATTVARTEAIGATNAGSWGAAVERARAAGEEGQAQKVWVSTMDSRTRASHRMADKQRVGLFEPFIVGGFPLRFPGDPSGPPQETINCRCSLIDVLPGEDINWTSRQFFEGE